MWYAVVSDYMLKNLTYDSDKLGAIAGLANEFEETRMVQGVHCWPVEGRSSSRPVVVAAWGQLGE